MRSLKREILTKGLVGSELRRSVRIHLNAIDIGKATKSKWRRLRYQNGYSCPRASLNLSARIITYISWSQFTFFFCRRNYSVIMWLARVYTCSIPFQTRAPFSEPKRSWKLCGSSDVYSDAATEVSKLKLRLSSHILLLALCLTSVTLLTAFAYDVNVQFVLHLVRLLFTILVLSVPENNYRNSWMKLIVL